MPEIQVPRTATAHPLITRTLSGAGGAPIGGQVVAQSVYDPTADLWLDMTDGTWGATKDTAVKTEVDTGIHVREVDVSQASAGTERLLAFGEVTSGTLAGLVDIEEIQLVDTTALIRDAILDRILAGNHEIAGSLAALVTAAGTGGIEASALRDAIFNTIRANYTTAGTVGEWVNSTTLSQLDDAVRILATELATLGLPILNTGRTHYTGVKGDTLTFQFYQDDEAISDAILETATALVLRMTPIDGGVTVEVTADLLLGGKAGYTLVDLDGIFEAANHYIGQAKATLPDSSLVYSEQRTFVVVDPI